MHRILLADDSPHAQRMGERILRDEGYEVVSVTDGETALLRLADVDPDLVLADVFLPGRTGLDMCRYIKAHPEHRHVRIVLTAGMLKVFDEAEAKSAGADAIIKKPFEASAVLELIKPLVAQAAAERSGAPRTPIEIAPTIAPRKQASKPAPAPIAPPAVPPVSDEELLRAAVTVALDAAFPALVQEITAGVLQNLKASRAGSEARKTEK